MGIKDKRNCILWGFTEKSDFQCSVAKKEGLSNIQGGLSKNGVLGQFADLRGRLAEKLGVFEGG